MEWNNSFRTLKTLLYWFLAGQFSFFCGKLLSPCACSHTFSFGTFSDLFPYLGVKTSISRRRTCCSHFKKQIRGIIAKNPGTHSLESKQRHRGESALLRQTLCSVHKEPCQLGWGAGHVLLVWSPNLRGLSIRCSCDGELVWAASSITACILSTAFSPRFFSSSFFPGNIVRQPFIGLFPFPW